MGDGVHSVNGSIDFYVHLKQLEFFDIPSPCIGVCQAGSKGYCLGCFRSRDERLHWNNLSSDVKRKINLACVRRKKRAKAGKPIHMDEQIIPIQQDLWGQ